MADAALFLNITERAVKAAARGGSVPFRYAGPEMVLAVEDLLEFATCLVLPPPVEQNKDRVENSLRAFRG